VLDVTERFDVYRVWEAISYAWTEIGIEDEECRAIAQKAAMRPEHLPEIDKIFFKDVCASFAVDSFLIIPLMFWMIMPDWGYSETYLRKRMLDWYAKPYWSHFLNPVRILGYPVAVFFALSYRSMLRKAVHANASA
jgi:hypothetical protein